jgi:hypothetical protein
MSMDRAKALGVEPRLVFRGYAVAGCEPDEMGIGPVFAVPRLLRQQGLRVDDVDVWELNEAFASQVIYCRDRLGIPADRLNVNGGSIAIGHPFGMTGSRLVGTLANEMLRRNARYGAVTMWSGWRAAEPSSGRTNGFNGSRGSKGRRFNEFERLGVSDPAVIERRIGTARVGISSVERWQLKRESRCTKRRVLLPVGSLERDRHGGAPGLVEVSRERFREPRKFRRPEATEAFGCVLAAEALSLESVAIFDVPPRSSFAVNAKISRLIEGKLQR